MIERVRRVVVRPDADHHTAVAFDGPSPHVHTLPGMSADLGLTDLWYTGDDAAASRVGPRRSGARGRTARWWLVVPGGAVPARRGGSEPFWHETPTVDYNVVLSGELVLVLETGTVALRGGATRWWCAVAATRGAIRRAASRSSPQ